MDINLGADIQNRMDKNIVLFDKGFNDIQELSSQKRLAHNSIGKLKDSWYKNREIVNDKFGNRFPVEIK